MNDKAFNPYVRFISRLTFYSLYPETVYAYDFRMFYVFEGSFRLELENNVLSLTEGDLVTLPPCTAYRLIFDEAVAVGYYIVNFNFDYVFPGEEARPPVPQRNFDKNRVFSVFSVKPFDRLFVMHNADMAEDILKEICDVYNEQAGYPAHMLSALMKYLLTKLVMEHTADNNASRAELLTEDIKKYIYEKRSTPVTNQSVAEKFGYHPHYLNALFLKTENITLHKYIDRVRIKYAKEMLLHTNKPVYEIAYSCGFNDASYFCKFFVRHTNMTPKEYRKLTK
ncbi:MAG: helix-turn-helix domain-containing protein [Clostridia bacterium]|nr:helix-turn-helix domain-containing protein [Clostridia bacterium]